jgi:hypothetical protein
MKNNKSLIVLGLALALPSTLLGVGVSIVYLIQQKIISQTVGLLIIVAVVFNTFYLMMRYAKKKKDKS